MYHCQEIAPHTERNSAARATKIRHMARFPAKYSTEQREAVALAAVDQRVRPIAKIRAAAQAGELTLRGELVAAFDMPESTIRKEASDLRRRRLGQTVSALAEEPDAIERLRKQLITMIEHEMNVTRRDQAAGKVVTGERLRQLGRALAEAESRERGERQTKAPGSKAGGTRDDSETRGGLAGAILADVRNDDQDDAHTAGDETATETPTTQHGETQRENDNAQRTATHTNGNPPDDADDDAPGGATRALAAELRRELASAG